MQHIYNYKFQSIDTRDFTFSPPNTSLLKSSSTYYITDTSPFQCPIFNQGSLGSCLANAIKAMLYIVSQGKVDISRLQLYMCYRAIDGSSLTQDTGGTVRGGMNAIMKYGVCPENMWPYLIQNFARLAPSKAFVSTYKLNNFVYTAVKQNIDSIKASLLINLPIVLGILIYTSFESPNATKYGTIPVPNIKTEKQLGGHAILLVGYDDATAHFKFQNSWGTEWGDKGYGYIPYQYILNSGLTKDLWNVYFTI